MNLQLATFNGHSFHATRAQIEALETLASTNGGGIAVVHGYVSESDRITPETADITFISRFSVTRLYERRIKALESLTYEQCEPHMHDSCRATRAHEIPGVIKAFNDRREFMIASCRKTLAGDRSDAHRQGHDRCYTRVTEGVRVNFKTVPDAQGIKQPVTLDGHPIAETILVDMIEISKRVTVPGEYKKKKSGVPVLMENAMMAVLPKSVKFKCLSLKENNFERLTIGGHEMLPEEFKGIF